MVKRGWWSKRLVTLLALAGAVLVALPAGAGARAFANVGPPVPGGVYTGTIGNGARISIRVASDMPTGVIRGTVKLSCGPGRVSFRSADGKFIVRGRHFTATGAFNIDRVDGKVTGRGRCRAASYRAKLSSPGDVRSTTQRYGPFDVGPMSMSMPMSSSMFNMQGTMQDFYPAVQRPCADCYIVGMVPDLVYPNGRVANYNTGVMLHHFVMFDNSQRSVTCPTWPQELIGSGNERTDMVLPAGYGYHFKAADKWSMLLELMNMSMQMQNLEVRITWYYRPASANVRGVVPLFLDVNPCGTRFPESSQDPSDYPIPAGKSDTVWTWNVPASVAGDMIAVGGHLHDYGTHITLTDTSSRDRICNSRAYYGTNKAYMGNIDAMGGCTGDPLARIHAGDTLRLDSYYNSPTAENNVMGIMGAFIAPGDHKTPPSARKKGAAHHR